MNAKEYIENKFSDRGTFDQIELPTFLLEEMLNEFAKAKNKELIEDYKDKSIGFIKKNGTIVRTENIKWWQKILIKIGFYKKTIRYYIRGIDTSKFNNGDKLYLDPNIPGGLTNNPKST